MKQQEDYSYILEIYHLVAHDDYKQLEDTNLIYFNNYRIMLEWIIIAILLIYIVYLIDKNLWLVNEGYRRNQKAHRLISDLEEEIMLVEKNYESALKKADRYDFLLTRLDKTVKRKFYNAYDYAQRQ